MAQDSAACAASDGLSFTDGPPRWLERSKLSLLWSCVRGGRQNWNKLRNLAWLVRSLLGGVDVPQNLDRLTQLGHIDARPTTAQLWLAAIDQVFRKGVADTREYYDRKQIPFAFHVLRRFLAQPTTMMDPIGLYASTDTIIHHLLQVQHRYPLYDLALLRARPGGLDELECQLDQLAAGTHLFQECLDCLVEDPAYHARLRHIVAEFRRRPLEVRYPDLSALDASLALAIDQFKDLRGFTNYASRIPASRAAVVVAALQVLFNVTAGRLLSVTLGPTSYRVDCCDAELRAFHDL